MEIDGLKVALHLADEGVPLRAIARATGIPSADLRERLVEAKEAGRIFELPRDDWPPGFPRDRRALELSRLAALDKHAVNLLVRQMFGLAPMEIELFLTLMQNAYVPKERIGMVPRTMDVHMSRIRKRLQPFGISILTLWGHGYQLSAADRRRALDHIFGPEAAALRFTRPRSLARVLSASAVPPAA